jgi:hypothetical protein
MATLPTGAFATLIKIMRISGSRLTHSRVAVLTCLGLSGLGLLLASSSPAQATTVTIQAFDIGNYCDYDQPSGSFYCPIHHQPTDTNYTTGYIDFSSADVDVAYRGFFAFNLDSQAILDALAANQQLTAATMRAQNFKVRCGVNNPTGSSCPPSFYYGQTISLYGVNGSLTDLINGTGNFNDLGQGTAYSAVNFTSIPPENSITSFSINQQGLALVSSKLGQQLALSSRNNREVGQSSQSPTYVFGAPSDQRSVLPGYLDLTFESQGGPGVPGPLPVLGAAAAYRVSRRLRRRCGEMRASEADAGIEQGHQ